QSLEKLFLGIPHLRIVAPSLYHNPGEMLKHAAQTSKGVTLFIEHKLLYPAAIFDADADGITVEVRDTESGYPTIIVRNYEAGRPDAAIICYGGMSLLLPPLLKKIDDEEIRLCVCPPG